MELPRLSDSILLTLPACSSEEMMTEPAPGNEGGWTFSPPFSFCSSPGVFPQRTRGSLWEVLHGNKPRPAAQPGLGPPGESCRIKGAHALIAGGDKGASTWLRHRNYCCTSNARFIYQFHSRKTHMTALFTRTLNLVAERSPPPVKCVMRGPG